MYVVGEGNSNGKSIHLDENEILLINYFKPSFGITIFLDLTVVELANIAITLLIMASWLFFQASGQSDARFLLAHVPTRIFIGRERHLESIWKPIQDFFRGEGLTEADFFPAPDFAALAAFSVKHTNWTNIQDDIDNIILPYLNDQDITTFGSIGTCWGGYNSVR